MPRFKLDRTGQEASYLRLTHARTAHKASYLRFTEDKTDQTAIQLGFNLNRTGQKLGVRVLFNVNQVEGIGDD